jgi:putative phosphoesterase
VITLGVVSDTHIPDRAWALHPHLLTIFREAQVTAILHAGDICTDVVIKQLAEIAPVHAVRGNRDIFYLSHLPRSIRLTYEDVSICLIHGHGRVWDYLLDKVNWLVNGMQVERYQQRALNACRDAQVVIFGHLHRPISAWISGKYVFNPGSACCPDATCPSPSVGLLHLDNGQVISGEIILL